MSDEEIKVALKFVVSVAVFLVFLSVLFLSGYATGAVHGRWEGRCAVRMELATTASDSLQLLYATCPAPF
jgi:hypothetical protein